MEAEKKRIDPESRDYDCKKDIDVDPRFRSVFVNCASASAYSSCSRL